jgi:hypothetical protein
MNLGSKCTSTWQAKIAFACTVLFSLASIGTNAVYGWNKGDTLPSSIIWAALAIAVGATLLLSTAALFKALAAKTYAQAAFIALGLLLCGTYSIVAATGSATGQRLNASLIEDATSTARSDAQKAIKTATSHLASLPTVRPSAAIQTEIDGILIDPRLEGCTTINGPRTKEACPRVAVLKTELATAQATAHDMAEAQAAMDRAHAELSALPPHVSNSDAKAIVTLLNALGYSPTVAQVNLSLALLSVLLVELGGSVSLAVGMALKTPVEQSVSIPLSQPPPTPLVAETCSVPQIASKDTGMKAPQTVRAESPVSVKERLLADVRGTSGGLRGSHGAMAIKYGVSPTRIGQVVRGLKKEGLVRVRSSRNGTTIVPELGLALVG